MSPGGQIRVEGKGLYGEPLRVDLLGRVLAVHAGVWAEHLNGVVGASRVDDATGQAVAAQGAGAAPAVVLDMTAAGGLYAGSVRLIGTEAGVGVNLGGTLVAREQVTLSTAGDMRLLPTAIVQAGRDLRVEAGRHAAIDGVLGAGGALALSTQGDLRVGAPGGLRARGVLLLQRNGRYARLCRIQAGESA